MHRIIGIVLLLASLAAFAQSPETRLFEAIDEGKPLVAEGILARSKVDVNAVNKERETPLHRAVEKGMKELGWTGQMVHPSFPGCTHPDGHATGD